MAGAAGMTMLVKNSMDSIDATAKLSDTLGIATERLSGLQHAASLSGVSQSELELAMQRTVRTFGNSDAFYKVADLIAQTGDSGERAKIAFDAFGKSGMALIPMMLGGSGGLREMEAEAKKLGIAMTRIDAAKVEAANDSFTRTGEVITGLGNTIAIQLAPFLEYANAKIVELATNSGGMGDMVSGAFNSIVSGIASAMDWISLLESGWYGFQSTFRTVIAVVMDGISMWATGWSKFLGVFGDNRYSDAMKSIARETEIYGNAYMEAAKDSAVKASEAYSAFANNKSSAAAEKMFSDIRAKAEENGKALTDRMKGMNAQSSLGIDDETKKKSGGKVSDFKQVSIHAFALGGSGTKKQEVEDKTLAGKFDKLFKLFEGNPESLVPLME
jgi:DNA-binding phage protein